MILHGKSITLIALAIMAAPIVACAWNPQFPIWLAILIGAILGGPVLVIGLRHTPDSMTNEGMRTSPSNDCGDAKSFWPTRSERWGLLAFFVLFVSYAVPLLFFVPLLLLMQAGDNWTIAIVRISLLSIALGASWWWFQFAVKKLPALFRGRLSDEVIDSFVKKPEAQEPRNTLESVLMNWKLLVIAGLAFVVAFGFVNLNNFAPQLGAGPRPVRGFGRALVWCQVNPNTVTLLSAAVGVFALALYAKRVFRSY